MATSSITKEYFINDDETCDRLIKILSEGSVNRKPASTKYEDGKRLIAEVRFDTVVKAAEQSVRDDNHVTLS